MFKCASVDSLSDRQEADNILKRVYDERPDHWPYGLDGDNFDGGLYLIREKQSNVPVGFCGWQVRHEFAPEKRARLRTGYYSIGILPEYRNNGYAKAAVARLIDFKSASVDRVKAMIVSGNTPSLELARSLNVPVMLKGASVHFSAAGQKSTSLYDMLLRVGRSSV